MNNTEPENNQVPAWFTSAATPISPQPKPKDSAKKKRLLLIFGTVAAILLIAGGVALYVMSVHNAKAGAIQNFRKDYLNFYSSFSSIDDITEPDGVDPADVVSRWKTYKDSLVSLENSQLFSDNKDVLAAIKSANAKYEPFITTVMSYVAIYMTACTFNEEAGAATISDGCFTTLQQIEKTADPISTPIAKELIGVLSTAQTAKVMSQDDITTARDLEGKLYGIPGNFASSTYPQIVKLGESAGIKFD